MQQTRSGIWVILTSPNCFFDATMMLIFIMMMVMMMMIMMIPTWLSEVIEITYFTVCWSIFLRLMVKSRFVLANHMCLVRKIFQITIQAHFCSSGVNRLLIPQFVRHRERRAVGQFCVLYFFAIIATSLIGKAEAFQASRHGSARICTRDSPQGDRTGFTRENPI